MDEQTEQEILRAFAELAGRVLRADRAGMYETTYWFDDDSHLQVINFDAVPAEEEGEEDTLDHTLQLQGPSFDVLVIGFYSGDWSFQLEEVTRPELFLRWHSERHPVVRVSGTD